MVFGLGFVSGSVATGLAVKYRASMQRKIAALAGAAEGKLVSAMRAIGAKL